MGCFVSWDSTRSDVGVLGGKDLLVVAYKLRIFCHPVVVMIFKFYWCTLGVHLAA